MLTLLRLNKIKNRSPPHGADLLVDEKAYEYKGVALKGYTSTIYMLYSQDKHNKKPTFVDRLLPL